MPSSHGRPRQTPVDFNAIRRLRCQDLRFTIRSLEVGGGGGLLVELGEVIELTSLGGKRFRHDDLFNQSLKSVSSFLHGFADGIDR